MTHLIKSILSTLLILINATYWTPAKAKDIEITKINKKLEFALNSNNNKYLKNIFSEKIYLDLITEKTKFLKRFSNVKWIVEPAKTSTNKKNIFDIYINGERNIDNLRLTFESRQKLLIERKKDKIISYSIIDEYSTLKSLNSTLEVDIISPKYVLTGTRYDMDIILKEPLGDNFLAGGLITTTNKKNNKNIKTPFINLVPLGSGGLFKSIQAPLEKGKQNVTALLVHPKGIISITKVVNIVSEKNKI